MEASKTITKQFRLLKPGDKIYDIDYEISGRSYTVLEVSGSRTPSLSAGLVYSVHADDVIGPKGFTSIYVRDVNRKNSQYYSSPELAHEAYEEESFEENFAPVFTM